MAKNRYSGGNTPWSLTGGNSVIVADSLKYVGTVCYEVFNIAEAQSQVFDWVGTGVNLSSTTIGETTVILETEENHSLSVTSVVIIGDAAGSTSTSTNELLFSQAVTNLQLTGVELDSDQNEALTFSIAPTGVTGDLILNGNTVTSSISGGSGNISFFAIPIKKLTIAFNASIASTGFVIDQLDFSETELAGKGRARSYLIESDPSSIQYYDEVTNSLLDQSFLLIGCDVTTGTTGSFASPQYDLETDASNSPIEDGLLSWSITNTGGAAGLVQGKSFPIGATISSNDPFLDPRSGEFRLPDGIDFDASGTEFTIVKITD